MKEEQQQKEVSSKRDITLYPMDTNPITVKINLTPSREKAVYATHVLRKPSFVEEEARERNIPLFTVDAGKIDGQDATSMTIDDEPANVELYDKIVMSVSGYGIKEGDSPSDEILPDTVVETPHGEKTVRELIPANHKNTAINGIFNSSFDVDLDEDKEFVFALGGGREWKIKQEIGGKVKREDGTLSPSDYDVIYTFKEPSEKERKDFRTKGSSAVTLRNPKTSAIVERRSTNLAVIRDLFDALIVNIEGATIEGKPIRATDKLHVDQIPSAFKKGCIFKLFGALEADLGN